MIVLKVAVFKVVDRHAASVNDDDAGQEQIEVVAAVL